MRLMRLAVSVACCVECCRGINTIMGKVSLVAVSWLSGGMAKVQEWRSCIITSDFISVCLLHL